LPPKMIFQIVTGAISIAFFSFMSVLFLDSKNMLAAALATSRHQK